jgi:DegV family protein with EDD domain
MSIHIITDSSADLTPADAQRLGVEVVSMSIQFGDRSYLDGIDLDKAQFYQLLAEDKTSPSTAQPTPADFLKPMEAARATGAEAVVITLSSILSGTHQSALIAKDMCSYGPIYVVDSLSATAGIQIMVEYACKLREQGLSAQEIAEQVETLKGRIRIFAVIDTLEYLRRGGRLSSLQAGLGTVTKLKPVIAVRDGAVMVVGKAFGTAAATKQLLKFLSEHPIDSNFPAFALYSDDRGRVDEFLPKLQEVNALPEDLRFCSIGPTIGTHIGPGAVGMAYVELS